MRLFGQIKVFGKSFAAFFFYTLIITLSSNNGSLKWLYYSETLANWLYYSEIGCIILKMVVSAEFGCIIQQNTHYYGWLYYSEKK